MKQLKSDLDCPIDQFLYWSDNTTVLRQIHSRTCRFEVYQANRLGEILEENGPGPGVWRYVLTDQNPADDACTGIDTAILTPNHRWLSGPSFLRDSPDTWPVFPSNVPLELDASSPGVRSVGWVGAITTEPSLVVLVVVDLVLVVVDLVLVLVDRLIARSSFLLSLCRTLAWIFRYARRFVNRWSTDPTQLKVQPAVTGPFLSVSEILTARHHLIRVAQETEFFAEIKDVEEGRPVRRTSRLLKASPFIDHHGLLRVGGRLRLTSPSHTAKKSPGNQADRPSTARRNGSRFGSPDSRKTNRGVLYTRSSKPN